MTATDLFQILFSLADLAFVLGGVAVFVTNKPDWRSWPGALIRSGLVLVVCACLVLLLFGGDA